MDHRVIPQYAVMARLDIVESFRGPETSIIMGMLRNHGAVHRGESKVSI